MSIGGTEVGNGPLVMFAVGPTGRLELARGDEAPVGIMVSIVELVASGMLGEDVNGAVMLATVVVFAAGGVGMVPLPVALGKGPGDEVSLPGKALSTLVLDDEVAMIEVVLVGTGYTIVVEVIGTTMLVVGETVTLAGREKLRVVEFNGTVKLRVEEIVALGRARVVEPTGTMTLVKEETVVLVGSGKAGVVRFEGNTKLVDAGTEADAFVGRGKARVVEFSGTTTLNVDEIVALVGRGKANVVEFKGMIILVEVVAETDVLLEAVSEVRGTDVVSMGPVGVPVPDGGRTDSELLPVGKGGRIVPDSGGGSEVSLPVGTGAKIIVEPVVMMILVAAAVPLTMMVVRLPVTAPADSIVLPGLDSEDALEVGNGNTSVVVLMGTMTLVAAAVPLMIKVDRVAVITPADPGAVLEAAVLLVKDAETDGGGVGVNTGLIVVTEGTKVLLM